MSSSPETHLIFTAEELNLLGRTADALSAYMGKPVLAEVIGAQETGFEWVLFGIPLGIEDDAQDLTIVQIGGAQAQILGNQGGLNIADGEVYDCQYLWAIQLSDLEGVRFIKVDQEGEEIAWSDDLSSILPFELTDQPLPDDDEEEENDEDEDDDDSLDQFDSPPSRLLH